MIENSGFEAGLNNWTIASGTATITPDAYAGLNGLRLSANETGVTQSFSATPGETYTLSGYGKTSSPDWQGLGLAFYDDQWTELSRTGTQITSSNWAEYTVDAIAPTGGVNAVLWTWHGGSGTTELDDLIVTGASSNPNELLSNPNFEAGLGSWEQFTGTEATTTTDPFEGVQALELTAAGSGVSQPVAITPGATYQLSGYAKSNSGGVFGVDLYTSDWVKLNTVTTPVTTTVWERYQLDITATSDAANAVPWFYKGDGNGSTTYDQVSFQAVASDPTPSTFALADSDTIFVNEQAGVATVTAVRIGNSQGRATLEYTLNEIGGADSATAGEDYTEPTFDNRPNTGQIVFEDGESSKSFTIPIIDDTAFEGNETFAVGLQNPSAGSLGTPRTTLITIVDNDAAPTLSISEPTINVAESSASVSVTVQRSGDTAGAASVNFSTSNGSAIAGSDYTATSGTLNFAANQTTRTITIALEDDIAVEGNESFTVDLSNPSGATLGNQNSSTITILDDDLELGDLTRSTVTSGLSQPTTLDWTSDGEYMLVAEKAGRVRVIDQNGVLRSTPLVDLSAQVNGVRDRGLLGLAIHPDFPSTPYVYLLYTYDPPETQGRSGLGGPDGRGNRPSRLARLTVNPTTMIADPNSLTVLAGKNSTWAYTSEPTNNSTGAINILPSGIVNGTTITAPASQIDVGTQDNDPDRAGIQNHNIRDYLATDSESHTIGDLEFGDDGYLYLSNGDGTSYNFTDPRTVRVQDIANLSGKVLRIDPITGEGVPTNPFYDGDGDSNQSKVFYSGVRNPFRFTFDPETNLPVIGDVGWNSYEEINTGPAGSNFGWPYLEGPNPTGGYQNLDQAVAFYNNGNRNNPGDAAAVFPLLPRTHGAPDNANAIMVGDFYNSNTLMFGDVNSGTLYAATLNGDRQVSNVQVFDAGVGAIVDLKMGPDNRLYGVNLGSGSIVRWNPDNTPAEQFVYNGDRYQLTNGFKSWQDAQAEAESLGGNLVTLNDSAEEAWVRQTFSTSERLWLGLNDAQSEGTFVWANGDPVTYTNWAGGEPNNFLFGGDVPEGEDYVVLNWDGAGRWNDYPNDFSGQLRGVIEIPG